MCAMIMKKIKIQDYKNLSDKLKTKFIGFLKRNEDIIANNRNLLKLISLNTFNEKNMKS